MGREIKESMDNSIRHWKIAGGLLISVLMLIVVTFGYFPNILSLMEIYPWLKYAFLAVLITTCFVFFVIWKKDYIHTENNELNITQDYRHQKKRVGFLLRIIAGLLGVILLVITVIFCIYIGFRGWMIITLIGGYSVLSLWIAIMGEKPFKQ
jgi:hypothetical protein